MPQNSCGYCNTIHKPHSCPDAARVVQGAAEFWMNMQGPEQKDGNRERCRPVKDLPRSEKGDMSTNNLTC